MHCPRCGDQASAGQQFCRSCGLGLDQVAELLGESVARETPGDEISRLKNLQHKHEKWSGIAGLITFGVILLTLIVLVFSGMILVGRMMIIPGSLLILLACGAGVMGYFQTSAKSLKRKLAESQLPQSKTPLSIELPRSLGGSVTDRTTALLSEPADRTTGEVRE